jgi:hypothetical protein
MATLTNSITNIINSGYISALSPTQNSSLVTKLVKSASYDSINFSDEAKKLYEISNIDSLFNGLFGFPAELNDEQKSTLNGLKSIYSNLLPSTTPQLQFVNLDEIYEKLGIENANKDDIKKVTNQLNSYITELSINQLFNTEKTNSFSLSSYTPFLQDKLSKDDIEKLGNLSLQLNRVIFSSSSNDISSYLDTFNNLYKLNNPSDKELKNSAELLTKRNMLLSSILLNKTPQNYMA